MDEFKTLLDALLKATPKNALQTTMTMFETIQNVKDKKGGYKLMDFYRTLDLYGSIHVKDEENKKEKVLLEKIEQAVFGQILLINKMIAFDNDFDNAVKEFESWRLMGDSY